MPKPHQTFFFYDLETSGLSPREDRIMQFAGQRTDLNLEKIGDPVNLLVKLAEDTLPSPYAITVTGITPQATRQDGLSEAELCDYLLEEIFTPGTIAVGYNSTRFDDEFIRHLFWRNFRDPYEWQWSDGRSKWDLLDVVRLTRALRPEGITWPVTESGRATNRLELLTKLNGIEHVHAHDALSDVEALIAVTRLIRDKQPQLYDYLFAGRGKRAVQKLVNLDSPRPVVYASGRYPGEFNHTTVVYPLAPGRNGNILVFDLRYDLEELLAREARGEEILPRKESEKKASTQAQTSNYSTLSVKSQEGKGNSGATSKNPPQDNSASPAKNPPQATPDNKPKRSGFFPIIKELCYNKCPAVAPVGVLSSGSGWEKIHLSEPEVRKNLQHLLKHPEFAERMAAEIQSRPEWPKAVDAESALYDGFLPEPDRARCAAVRNADATKLADFRPEFIDERLSSLLLHYKARNFPQALAAGEAEEWEAYRAERLNRQAPGFLAAMETLSKQAQGESNQTQGKDGDSKGIDPYLLEELTLWYQSLL